VLVDVLGVTVEFVMLPLFIVEFVMLPLFIVESLEGVEGETLVSVLDGVCVVLGSKVESGADVLGIDWVEVLGVAVSVEGDVDCVSIELLVVSLGFAVVCVESLGVWDESVDVFDCGVVVRRSLFGVILGFCVTEVAGSVVVFCDCANAPPVMTIIENSVAAANLFEVMLPS